MENEVVILATFKGWVRDAVSKDEQACAEAESSLALYGL